MNVKDVFSERLENLRIEQGITRQKVADDLQISRASLEYYEKGKRVPDIVTLCAIAEYYNVSADYLLGRTTNKTTDTNLQDICEYTGLTEEAINFLNKLQDRANGEDISPKWRENVHREKKYCEKKQAELDNILLNNPKVKEVVNKYLHYRRNNNYKEVQAICTEFEDITEYKEAFYIMQTLTQYEKNIEEEKIASIHESKCALLAISEIFSASDCEMFINNLSLFFSNFYEFEDNKEINIFGKDFIAYQQTVELSNKVIEVSLLNEIQNYLKAIKKDIYNRQITNEVFYSIDIKDKNKNE